HATCHDVTFDTLRVKASFSWRKVGSSSDLRPNGGVKRGNRKWEKAQVGGGRENYFWRAGGSGFYWALRNNPGEGKRRLSRPWPTLLLLVFASPLVAAEGDPPQQRITNDRQIIDLLARVHDQGAALFNAGDHGGCYRMFQGALVTAKLVLPREIQELVDRGLS